MKFLFAAALVSTAVSAGAQVPKHNCPSCNLEAQRALKSAPGGSIKDAGQAHISARANVIEADIGSARKARNLTTAETDGLLKRVERVRHATAGFVKKQGFLSAAERASYDRELDEIAMRICRK